MTYRLIEIQELYKTLIFMFTIEEWIFNFLYKLTQISLITKLFIFIYNYFPCMHICYKIDIIVCGDDVLYWLE